MRLTLLRSRIKLTRMTLCGVVSMFKFFHSFSLYQQIQLHQHMQAMQYLVIPSIRSYTIIVVRTAQHGLHQTNAHIQSENRDYRLKRNIFYDF